jgi:hypothetical protein
VILKLAKGHLAFEQNEPRLDEPTYIHSFPLCAISNDARDEFEEISGKRALSGWPEVGSRAMTRIVEGSDEGYPWIEVQPRRYRYLVSADVAVVRLVIAEYLAAEIHWG